MTAMSWNIIRTPSSRKELKYEVIKVSSDLNMDSAIVEHVHRAISSYQPDDRAIVFCRSKENVRNLATLFKTHPYYAPDDDEDLKRNNEAMVRWVTGESKVMTSTSILGCGMDYSHIRDVVHRDPSFNMLDQYQEDSRGGRDGLQCRATTFIVDKKVYSITNPGCDLGSKVLYESLVDPKQCRRIAPTIFLDGQASQCITLPGAQFCDICESAVTMSSSGRPFSIPTQPATKMSNLTPVSNPVSSSSNLQPFSPPRRSLDLFDPSPRIDLRQHLFSLKRKHSSLDSTSSAVSHTSNSSKSVRFSDIPTYLTSFFT